MIKNLAIGLRRAFFWTEADGLELAIIGCRKALFDAEENAEMAKYSIKMLEDRIARLRKGEFGDQAKASIDIGQAQQKLDEMHITYEVSMRDVRIMRDRIPRLQGHLSTASKSLQVTDKTKFFQPTTY